MNHLFHTDVHTDSLTQRNRSALDWVNTPNRSNSLVRSSKRFLTPNDLLLEITVMLSRTQLASKMCDVD